MANDAPTKEEIAQLKEEHGKIVVLESDGYNVVLAKPSKANIKDVYTRFMEQASDGRTKAKALTALFKSCVVYPDKPDVDAMLEDLPGLGATFGQHGAELIGLRDAEVKKY